MELTYEEQERLKDVFFCPVITNINPRSITYEGDTEDYDRHRNTN